MFSILVGVWEIITFMPIKDIVLHDFTNYSQLINTTKISTQYFYNCSILCYTRYLNVYGLKIVK